MLRSGLLNLQFAQHVSGTVTPIIRSLRLYRCLQPVAHNPGYGWSWVWCVAVDNASGLRDVALHIIDDARTSTHQVLNLPLLVGFLGAIMTR